MDLHTVAICVGAKQLKHNLESRTTVTRSPTDKFLNLLHAYSLCVSEQQLHLISLGVEAMSPFLVAALLEVFFEFASLVGYLDASPFALAYNVSELSSAIQRPAMNSSSSIYVGKSVLVRRSCHS